MYCSYPHAHHAVSGAQKAYRKYLSDCPGGKALRFVLSAHTDGTDPSTLAGASILQMHAARLVVPCRYPGTALQGRPGTPALDTIRDIDANLLRRPPGQRGEKHR